MYGSAIAMLVSGILLSFINFFMVGYIVNSVLVYLSQALVYSGAIYGVSIYIKQNLDDYKTEATAKIKDYIDNKSKE